MVPRSRRPPTARSTSRRARINRALIRLDGLDTVRRLDIGTLKLTPQLLVQAKEYQVKRGQQGPASPPAANVPLKVAIRDVAPTVDGKLGDWKDADWAKIDDRSRAAVCVSGDKLYVAYHIDHEYRLENSPDSLDSLFKGGPALDLMIVADPNADPQRKTPVAGDIRLLVTQVNNQTRAAVFRAIVPGTKEPVKYESPVGSATIDQVEDISSKVKLAGGRHADKTGKERRGVPVLLRYADYEFSVPLSALGLVAKRRPDDSRRRGVAAGHERGHRRSCLLAQQVRQHDIGPSHRGAAHARPLGTVDLPAEA